MLPKKITPNPLFISTIELRFHFLLEEKELLSKLFPVFSEELPKLTSSKFPKEVRDENEHLRYASAYTLQNDLYSLSFGERVLTFENVNDYTLWDNYFDFIKRQLNKFFELNFESVITRVGVRYASIFEKGNDEVPFLKNNPFLNVEGFNGNYLQYRANYQRDNYYLHLNLSSDAKVVRPHFTKSGTVIDIDASCSNTIPCDESIFKILTDLHSLQKTFFFELIDNTFLNSLNPEY